MGTDESSTTASNFQCGPVVERTIQDRIDRNEDLAVLFIDITNLEPYCQKYGWRQGAQLVDMLAEVLLQSVAVTQNAQAMLGHVLADNFILVTTAGHAEPLAKEIISRFDARVTDFYSAEDRQQGFFDAVDRRGNPIRARIAGVAIAIITNSQRAWEHALQVELIAAEITNYIKLMPGSRYAFDRRRN